MKKLEVALFLVLVTALSACSQSKQDKTSSGKLVGGGCEGCEAIFEYGSKKLNWVDTLPDYNEQGPKMEISGTIYQKDGKTPASNVILYIYHTNQKGYYSTKENDPYSKGWGKRHGYIRGWIKTGPDGKYKFYTLRPAHYPERNAPEHIHPVIKEADRNEYWIDEYEFDDDPLLTKEKREMAQGRGGKGIISLIKNKKGILVANRDIILGLNIPDY